jgi:hypothetical protein
MMTGNISGTYPVIRPMTTDTIPTATKHAINKSTSLKRTLPPTSGVNGLECRSIYQRHGTEPEEI